MAGVEGCPAFRRSSSTWRRGGKLVGGRAGIEGWRGAEADGGEGRSARAASVGGGSTSAA